MIRTFALTLVLGASVMTASHESNSNDTAERSGYIIASS